MTMVGSRVLRIQLAAFQTAFDKLGDCVELETGIHYRAPDDVVCWVVPNLMARLPGMAPGPDRARTRMLPA